MADGYPGIKEGEIFVGISAGLKETAREALGLAAATAKADKQLITAEKSAAGLLKNIISMVKAGKDVSEVISFTKQIENSDKMLRKIFKDIKPITGELKELKGLASGLPPEFSSLIKFVKDLHKHLGVASKGFIPLAQQIQQISGITGAAGLLPGAVKKQEALARYKGAFSEYIEAKEYMKAAAFGSPYLEEAGNKYDQLTDKLIVYRRELRLLGATYKDILDVRRELMPKAAPAATMPLPFEELTPKGFVTNINKKFWGDVWKGNLGDLFDLDQHVGLMIEDMSELFKEMATVTTLRGERMDFSAMGVVEFQSRFNAFIDSLSGADQIINEWVMPGYHIF